MTIDQLTNQLVTEGGAIVSSSACSEMEIADAQATGRFSVREDGMGFVRRYPEWLAFQQERQEKLSRWEAGAAEILPPGSDMSESGVPKMFFDSFEELKKELASINTKLDERIKSSREWGDVLVGKDRRAEADPYYWMAAGLEEFRNELSGQNVPTLAHADENLPNQNKTQ